MSHKHVTHLHSILADMNSKPLSHTPPDHVWAEHQGVVFSIGCMHCFNKRILDIMNFDKVDRVRNMKPALWVDSYLL